MEITHETLILLLDYDRVSGIFTWKKTGKRAGSIVRKGYIRIGINGGDYMAHRLAWLYVNGEWPREQIDHIDGNTSNNSISNLREATNQQNQFNTKVRSDNKSGYRGVSWHKGSEKWRAVSGLNGKIVSLGLFDTKEEASAAYQTFVSSVHGEFVRYA